MWHTTHVKVPKLNAVDVYGVHVKVPKMNAVGNVHHVVSVSMTHGSNHPGNNSRRENCAANPIRHGNGRHK